MKILFINCIYYPFRCSGAEKILYLLSDSLAKQGHDLRILTLTDKKKSSSLVNGIKVDRIPIKNLYLYQIGIKKPFLKKILWHLINIYNPFYTNELQKYLKENKPDIVNTHNITGFTPSLFSIIKKNKIPLVHTMHDQYLLCFKCTMFDSSLCQKKCLKCKFLKFNYKKHVSNVDHFIGVSKFITKKHIAYDLINKKKSSTIQNIITKPVNFQVNKNKYKINKIIRFGYIGTISEEKGVNYLINQILKLINLNENKIDNKFTLLIAGSGDPQIEKKIVMNCKKFNSIKYQGFIESSNFFPSIDMLIVPSLWEDTYPTVVLESLSNNVPVIASKLGGMPELITNNINGILFNPNNGKSDELMNIIYKIVKNPSLITYYKKNINNNNLNTKKSISDWSIQQVNLFKKIIKNYK